MSNQTVSELVDQLKAARAEISALQSRIIFANEKSDFWHNKYKNALANHLEDTRMFIQETMDRPNSQ